MKVHKGCGGEIKNRKCAKCGKTWSRLGYLLTGEVAKKGAGFDEREYKKRIREGRDIKR